MKNRTHSKCSHAGEWDPHVPEVKESGRGTGNKEISKWANATTEKDGNFSSLWGAESWRLNVAGLLESKMCLWFG